MRLVTNKVSPRDSSENTRLKSLGQSLELCSESCHAAPFPSSGAVLASEGKGEGRRYGVQLEVQTVKTTPGGSLKVLCSHLYPVAPRQILPARTIPSLSLVGAGGAEAHTHPGLLTDQVRAAPPSSFLTSNRLFLR